MDLHSSSSSFSYAFTYDVFLSFRGFDTRHGFTGNLYKAFCDKGIHTFIDDEELQRGDEITLALVKAIHESRIAIPIFSINYASSSFCLDELVTIIDHIKTKGRLVFPVFYNVDPSYVRHQIGTYGEALAKHEARFKNNNKRLKDNMKRLQKWKTALNQAANLSGYHYKHGDGYEHEFIGNIVEEVSRKISRVPLPIADYPVGLESQMLMVNSLLDIGSDDGVHMIGIHGIGGVGKTTLAIAIYNSIADYFESLCFLENVRENSNKQGLQYLQSIILSELVGDNKIKLTSVKQGMSIIKQRLRRKKVLLIMDDVDKQEQLQAIAGRLDWFGPGSRVIITTRDQQLLACNNVKRTYEVKVLNKEESLRLLSWNAFKSEKVDPNYENVSNRVITYASGLPLALEVIGSTLCGKSIKAWESAINQYERIPNNKILEILKISFHALDEEEKNVFLDIACCFKGYNLEGVKDILHAHQGYCVEHHIGVLVDKSLIKITLNNQVTLHDLIEDMGKEIVRQESPREPSKCSRLWFHEDIVQVLEHNKGNKKIEIIHLQFPLFEAEEKEVEWDGDAFKSMKNLKTLIIKNGRFSKGPKHLPNSLRVLEWERYPSQNLPDGFHPKKLAIWKFTDSSLSSAGLILKKEFTSLTILNFDGCDYLTEVPDVSCFPNLENLSFNRCLNLSTIHHSVGLLDKLKVLSATNCFKLRSFPPIKLSSLEVLNLWNSCLEIFPEVLGKMQNIKELLLGRSPIKKFPHSFQNLIGLISLEMDFPGKLSNSDADSFLQSIVTMPNLTVIRSSSSVEWLVPNVSSSNVQIISLEKCELTDEFFPTVAMLFANVKELILPQNNFIVVPECIKECTYLKKLDLSYCEHLQEIRGIPPNLECFEAEGCESLTWLSRSMFLNQDLHEAGNTWFRLPATEIPEWFEHQSRGTSVSFWFRNKFPTLVLYFRVVANSLEKLWLKRIILTINSNEYFLYLTLTNNDACLLDLRNITFNHNLNEALLRKEWNQAEFRYDEDYHSIPTFIEIGIHVLKREYNMEDVQFTDPYKKRKLVDDLNSSEPQNKSPKRHRFEDIEIYKTQFERQQQRIGFLSRMWNWVRSGFSFLTAPAMHSLEDNVNEDLSSMISTQIRGSTGVRGEADREKTEEHMLEFDGED